MSPIEQESASEALPAAAAGVERLRAADAGSGGGDDDVAASCDAVTFESTDPDRPLVIPARYCVPTSAAAKHPAVVIVHGSSGVDTRGPYYARLLNRAGIATLEIDMWSPRGLGGGSNGRPHGVVETLPDAFGALRMLAADPRIDARRIGIMGFSWGGVVSMLTATRPYVERYAPAGLRFAAHAPLYPICWVYNRVPGYEFSDLTGATVFIQAGGGDAYDAADSCARLVGALPAAVRPRVSAVVYPGASHAWDRLEPAITVDDRFSHQGAGGSVDFVPDPALAEQSRAATVAYFGRAFGL